MNNNVEIKSLNRLLQGLTGDLVLADLPMTIAGLTCDSRQVSADSLFVALNGANTDGRLYIDGAIELGAGAILCEAEATNAQQVTYRGAVPVIAIVNLTEKLSEIASRFYQYPQNAMQVIGITGTNGKTTVTQLIGQWLNLLGHQSYTMGTLGNGLQGQLEESPNTTLNAIDLIAHLAQARRLGCDYVVMEVSSHGLELARVKSIQFDVTAFTNLSQDHLDFHGDMASYANAKRQLFTEQYTKNAVLNANDPTALTWIKQWQPRLPLAIFNGDLASPYLVSQDVEFNAQGIKCNLHTADGDYQLQSSLVAKFNLDNLLCALATLNRCGFSLPQLLKLTPQISAVTGRMEVFQQHNSPTVVVDYAHTPDALEKALSSLRSHCEGQLYVVFGCGGDRDSSKRALMAKAAQQFADHVVITQDNSRSEAFEQILEDILQGITRGQPVTIEPIRVKAIEQTVQAAVQGDIILLAGKGHENYQIIGQQRLDYDERALAKQLVGAYCD